MSFSRASGCPGYCANTRSSENSPVVSATLRPFAGEAPRREVEGVRTERDRSLLGRCTRYAAFAVAPQHRVDPGNQFARIERLRQVVVGAHFQTDDAIDVLALGRQHDDRHRFAGAAQPPAHGESILAGQHEVEHDEVGRVALELAVEVARVGERGDLESLFAQIAGQQVAQADVVVDDENLRGARLGSHDAIRAVGR